MNFVVRSARISDLNSIFNLAKQFSLLNLPADKKILSKKLEKSAQSFLGELDKAEAEYLFVLEDLEQSTIVGCSQIIAKHGSKDFPHFAYQMIKKNHYSDDLGIGFIHQVLRLKLDTDGPSEIGGLLIDRSYRSRPEKLGRLMSLVRFIYVAMYRERFENRFVCELSPPLTDDGKSIFWESIGQKFTGMSYQEADLVSQTHKEFISTLFPKEDIYLNLLDPQVRLAAGAVGPETIPAQRLLENIGFEYLNEIDPFDGGPHYGAITDQISVVKNAQKTQLVKGPISGQPQIGYFGFDLNGEFTAIQTSFFLQDDMTLMVDESVRKQMNLNYGDVVFVYITSR